MPFLAQRQSTSVEEDDVSLTDLFKSGSVATAVSVPTLPPAISFRRGSTSQDTSNDDNSESDTISENASNGEVVYDSSRRQEKGTFATENGNAGADVDRRIKKSAEMEALREVGQFRGSSLIPGFRASNNLTEDDASVPTAIPKATQTPQTKFVEGQARGYTMLYLMHPKARQTVEKQIEAMLRAKVSQLYLSVLVDGTFGKDINYLTSIVRRINRDARGLTLHFYFTNGPTQRDFEGPAIINAPFVRIDPQQFRLLIQNDKAIQEQYLDIIRSVLPILQLNKRLNEKNRNLVTVMLEDNLDDASYLAMRSLAQPLIGTRADFVRNPCQCFIAGNCGCVEGSTNSSLGDEIESHLSSEIENLGLGDGFSLDGEGYQLPNESGTAKLDYQAAKSLMIEAASRGLRYFGLWRHPRQGLTFGQAEVDPDDRQYEVPSEADILNEIELLRAGLIETDSL